jgi:hypothetical protein
MLLLGAGVVGRSIVSRIGVAWLILFTAPVLLSMPGERNIYLASVGLALFIGAAYRGLTVHDATLPGTRVARSAWWRRASLAVLAIWLVVGASQETLMGRVTMAGEKLYRQIESMVPEPAQGARIYVVHQSPLNSVGFAQAIQLRYGRSDVTGCALTLSPTIAASQDDRVEATGPNSIRIARSEGRFFGSFVERFHLFAQPAAMLADLGGRFGVELLDPPTSYDGLTELEFRLPYSLDDPRLVILYWDNHRIRKTRDLRRIGDLSELVRWQPREGSDN